MRKSQRSRSQTHFHDESDRSQGKKLSAAVVKAVSAELESERDSASPLKKDVSERTNCAKHVNSLCDSH